MAKSNPALLKRPKRETWDVVLCDPAQNELTFTLTLRGLDALGAMDAQSRADVLYETYGPDTPASMRKLLPLVDGGSIAVSRHACQIVGTIMAAQAALHEDAYTHEEVFQLLASSAIASQIIQAVGEITAKSMEIQSTENSGPLASGSPSSSPPSNSDADTPTLSISETGS